MVIWMVWVPSPLHASMAFQVHLPAASHQVVGLVGCPTMFFHGSDQLNSTMVEHSMAGDWKIFFIHTLVDGEQPCDHPGGRFAGSFMMLRSVFPNKNRSPAALSSSSTRGNGGNDLQKKPCGRRCLGHDRSAQPRTAHNGWTTAAVPAAAPSRGRGSGRGSAEAVRCPWHSTPGSTTTK